MSSISFLITTHNEGQLLDPLISQLRKFLETDPDCEVVVLDDYSTDAETLQIFDDNQDILRVVKHKLNKNFGEHKQFGNTQCHKDYIFQIDADEYFSDGLLYGLKTLADMSPDTELFTVPRINIIRGLTQEEVMRWGWRVMVVPDFIDIEIMDKDSEQYKLLESNDLIISQRERIGALEVTFQIPVINFPDRQTRFYKNAPHIKWERPLHEHVVGFSNFSHIQGEFGYSLIHDKTLTRQLEQNTFYVTNFSREMNVRS